MVETLEKMDREIELKDKRIMLLANKTRHSDEQNLRETEQNFYLKFFLIQVELNWIRINSWKTQKI